MNRAALLALAVVAVPSLSFATAACNKPPPDEGAAATSSRVAPTEAQKAKPSPSSPPPAASADLASKIAGSILVGDGAGKYLRDLSDHHGQRLTGTPGYASAAEWVEQELKKAGVDAAHREPFSIEHGWSRGAASARIVEPIARELHVEQIGWTPPTSGALRAEVAVLKELGDDKIKADAARLKGKIVLLAPGANAWKRKGKRPRPAVALRDAGVVATMMEGRKSDNVTTAHGAYTGRALGGPFPAVDLGKEDSALVMRLAEQGAVTVEMTTTGALSGPTNVDNVVGEIKGRDLPNEWIVIGAHLDAWDYGQGSQDNGAGVAEVLEVARAIKASGYAPRRSIRFILWGGEEQGLFGSRAYVKAHEAEMGSIVAVLNTDNGAGRLKGWHAEGRDDLEPVLKEFSKQRLAGIGADAFDDEVTCDTDHCPFMLEGIPNLNLWVDMDEYMKVHHAPGDTFDKVAALDLNGAAAVVALTAIEIADRDGPLGARLPHDKVGAILKKHELLDELVEEGMFSK